MEEARRVDEENEVRRAREEDGNGPPFSKEGDSKASFGTLEEQTKADLERLERM